MEQLQTIDRRFESKAQHDDESVAGIEHSQLGRDATGVGAAVLYARGQTIAVGDEHLLRGDDPKSEPGAGGSGDGVVDGGDRGLAVGAFLNDGKDGEAIGQPRGSVRSREAEEEAQPDPCRHPPHPRRLLKNSHGLSLVLFPPARRIDFVSSRLRMAR